jgi:hypothetical protein
MKKGLKSTLSAYVISAAAKVPLTLDVFVVHRQCSAMFKKTPSLMWEVRTMSRNLNRHQL